MKCGTFVPVGVECIGGVSSHQRGYRRQRDHTPTSPAFSIADDASALAFTVYERGRPRRIVRGLRINALGFPVEIAAIRALDGPRPRWQFDFGFRVGF